MYERFTDRARMVMQLANQEAQRFNHEYIGTEHILLGLVTEASGVAANVLKNLDVDLRKIRVEVERIVQHGSGGDQVIMGRLPHTPRSKKVIEYTIEEAQRLNHQHVGTEHLLLGLLRVEEGVAAQVLMNLGLNLDDVRQEVLNVVGNDPTRTVSVSLSVTAPMRKGRASTPALDSFCRDLSAEGRGWQLEIPHGRADEVEHILRLLFSKAINPLIIGDRDDVRMLVVGVAHRSTQLAPGFESIRLLELLPDTFDAASESQVVERVKAMVNEATRRPGVWIVVRSAHPFGRSRCVRDANDRLRLLVAAGRIRVIWSVTPDEQTQLLADPDLAARLRSITLSELPNAALIQQLKKACNGLEDFHRLQILDEAVLEAVRLGRTRAVALALLDEAGAAIRLRHPTRHDPMTKELDAEYDALTAAKEKAVADQRFDEAAELRDRAHRLHKRRNEILKEWRQQQPPPGTVTAADVREVIGHHPSVVLDSGV